MCATELASGTHARTQPMMSACCTFLPLHRALTFIVKLIEGVQRANEGAQMAHVGQYAYDTSIGTYHAWWVRRCVHAALTFFPDRRKLMFYMTGKTEANVSGSIVVLAETIGPLSPGPAPSNERDNGEYEAGP